LHKGKIFLIGPTTGIAGIFRGPFYYYLIAPFYLIGGRDPVWPSVFLSFLTVLANLLIYYLGFKFHSRTAGLIGATIASFSFNITIAARWLSNPTPMMLLSMLLILVMYLIASSNKKGRAPRSLGVVGWLWAGLGFLAGISLFHFGSSGEFFYLPALAIFALWQRKTLNLKIILITAFAFLLTASPLIIFDLRHEGILRNNLIAFLFKEEQFKASFAEVLKIRSNFYYDVFKNKVFISVGRYEYWLITATTAIFLFNFKKIWSKTGNKILILMLASPMIGLLFFQGNEGNIYDYYMTGYYLIFILLLGITLASVWKYKLGKLFIILFLIIFINNNLPLLWSRINDGADGPNTILFKNQKQALDWIYEDAKGEDFNTDVYVPPVIPHAYDYLFRWYGKDRHGPIEPLVPLLYTLYEVDPPHPERLEEWMDRQAGIGETEYSATFGGITVQRRHRI
jgi:4-amino-4-deoxy-L-arabinose transferase-like glycosyltransferase